MLKLLRQGPELSEVKEQVLVADVNRQNMQVTEAVNEDVQVIE